MRRLRRTILFGALFAVTALGSATVASAGTFTVAGLSCPPVTVCTPSQPSKCWTYLQVYPNANFDVAAGAFIGTNDALGLGNSSNNLLTFIGNGPGSCITQKIAVYNLDPKNTRSFTLEAYY